MHQSLLSYSLDLSLVFGKRPNKEWPWTGRVKVYLVKMRTGCLKSSRSNSFLAVGTVTPTLQCCETCQTVRWYILSISTSLYSWLDFASLWLGSSIAERNLPLALCVSCTKARVHLHVMWKMCWAKSQLEMSLGSSPNQKIQGTVMLRKLWHKGNKGSPPKLPEPHVLSWE